AEAEGCRGRQTGSRTQIRGYLRFPFVEYPARVRFERRQPRGDPGSTSEPSPELRSYCWAAGDIGEEGTGPGTLHDGGRGVHRHLDGGFSVPPMRWILGI